MKIKPPVGLTRGSENIFACTQRGLLKVFLRLKNEPHFYQFLLSSVVIFLFLILLPSAKIQRIENNIHDLFFRHRLLPVHPAIAVVEVAEDSLQSLGRWPWSRNYHAVLTHILHEWGASAVVFDVLFTESSVPQDDKAFEEALNETTRNGYFAAALEPHGDKNIWMKPIRGLEASAKGVGHINIVPDPDGTLRRIKPYLKEGAEGFPHLALLVAYDYLGKSMDFEKEKPFPLDAKGNLLINWAGPWQKTFQHYSYVDLLLSYQALQSGRKPIIRPEEIKGKICLIGITATGLADIKANPLEGAYPALGVHANVINSVLTGRFLKLVPVQYHALILVSIGLTVLLFLIPFRNLLSLCMITLMSMGWVLGSFFLFQKGVVIFTLQPILLIITLYIFSAAFALLIANKERFHFFQLATRDGLTGLYVIRHFRGILEEAIVRAEKVSEPLAVILIDIDNFKKINDTYGHQAGDMVLRGTAQHVESSVRYKRATKEMDYVARYGGEEIIVLLQKSNLMDAAFKVAERIRKTVEQMSYTWENQKIAPTISLGVSSLRPNDTAETLIRRADEALYRAKKEGKNRVCIEEGVLQKEAA